MNQVSKHFESVAEFRDWLAREQVLERFGERDPAWAGGTAEDAARLLRDGDRASVDESERLLDRFTTEILERLPGLPERSPSLWGTTPRVAAYLQGDPLSMWRTLPGDEPRPLRVWLNLWAWCERTPKELRERAIASLAYVRAAGRAQPVELWIGNHGMHNGSGRTAQLWMRACTDDVSEIAALANVCVYRHAFLGAWSPLLGRSVRTSTAYVTARPERYAAGDVDTGPANRDAGVDWIANLCAAHTASAQAVNA